MAVQTRPYYLVYKGNAYMVEAVGPAGAVKHVVGAEITELRPARGSEVAAWHRENPGKSIPIAGKTEPVAPAAGDAASTTQVAVGGTGDLVADAAAEFTADDAIAWLRETATVESVIDTFIRVRAEQRMTLAQFDTMRVGCPAFEDAIIAAVSGLEGDSELGPVMVDDVRAHLEDQPIPLSVVVGAIGEAVRNEFYVPVEPPAAPEPHFPADGSEAEF
jgi:hypothetical protein